MRPFLVIVATLVTATCVSLAGVVAWVGLMVPRAPYLLFLARGRGGWWGGRS